MASRNNNAQVAKLRQRVTDFSAGFSTGQKAVSALAALGLVVGGLVFTSWSSKPAYAALFSNLEATDASAITQQLAAKKVPYKLAADGRTVMVPQSDVHQLRLDMSAAGLPSGGSGGYALLDKQGITTSEFRQRVDYQRALEGELAKTIEAIDGVAGATVHLVIPADDVFADDAKKPTASVLVKNSPGQRLDPGQVQAVVHLVSSSVEGLDPAAVTVADAKGRVLSVPGEEGDALGDARADKTREFEDALSRSVQDMLTPVTGVDGAVVRVKADLDFDKRETVTKNVDKPQVAEETTGKENFQGTAPPVGGILGPDAQPATPGTGDSNYTKDAAQRKFAMNEVNQQVKAAPGSVRRLSVAVLLDDKAQGADPAVVERLVSAAVGFDEARGDTIAVEPMAFDRSGADDAAKELAQAEAAKRAAERAALVRMLAVGGAVALVLLVLYIRSRRRGPARVPVALPADVVELKAAAPATTVIEGTVEDDVPELEAASAAPALEAPAALELEARTSVQDQVEGLIEQQPDEVAQLLRGWLAERRSA